MDILELIDSLEDLVDNASSLPLTGKCLVDRDKFFELVQEIRLQMPDDLKQAKWVKDERQRILIEAQKEADGIIKSAEEKIVSLINEHEITKQAQEAAEVIIANAQKNAKDIRIGTREYADGVLEDLQNMIRDIKNTLYKSLNQVAGQAEMIEKTIHIIDENRSSLKN